MGMLDYPYGSPVPKILWLLYNLCRDYDVTRSEIVQDIEKFSPRTQLEIISDICEAYC